jgi:hypothetical protein
MNCLAVILVKTGIQWFQPVLDSCFRRNDEIIKFMDKYYLGGFLIDMLTFRAARYHQRIKVEKAHVMKRIVDNGGLAGVQYP